VKSCIVLISSLIRRASVSLGSLRRRLLPTVVYESVPEAEALVGKVHCGHRRGEVA